MAVRRRRFGWVRKLRLSREEQRALSWDAAEGRDFTERLAENAWQRRQQALKGIAPDRLTVRQLAAEEGLSPSAVYERLRKFRIAAFGRDLSDNAIYDRLRKEKRRPGSCQEPLCTRPLPADAPTNRRYCNRHNSAAARTRRHRRKKQRQTDGEHLSQHGRQPSCRRNASRRDQRRRKAATTAGQVSGGELRSFAVAG